MKKIINMVGMFTLLSTSNVYAGSLNFGDAQSDQGNFRIAGMVRGAYVYKDFADKANEGSNNGKFRFHDIKLILNYENPNWLASMDSRCYQVDRLCDVIIVRDAWLGYKLSQNSLLSVGQQDIDFGFGRLWGNTNYGTLFSTVGLEDVQNLGIKYKLQHNEYNLTLGFYPRDAGNFKGLSTDASRYGSNFVEADDLSQGSNIEEKNMWVTRVSKNFNFDESQNFKTEIGASYWHSDLENQKTQQDGNRDTWSVFATTDYKNWQWLLLAGQQKIDNADNLSPDDSTMGSFDSNYQVANDGQFMISEINYTFKKPFKNIGEIKPYVSYGNYMKDHENYLDSNRLSAGVYVSYKDLGIQAEYLLSQNDPVVGGSINSLGQGDNKKSNQLFALAIGYFF